MEKHRGTPTAALASLIALGLLLGTAGTAAAQQPSRAPSRYAPGELIIGYEGGTTRAARADVRQDLGAGVESVVTRGVEVLDLPEGTSVEEAVAEAEQAPGVRYAEPNYVYRSSAAPNDPMFGELWSLGLVSPDGRNSGIDTPRVWNLTTGTADVTVAVVDSGMDAAHPDLAPNLWTNGAEIPGNAKDDDANGLTDDVAGWDWVTDDSNPADESGHGTHVSGIIGARGNNGAGVAGVAWDVRLMPLRVLDAAGAGWTSDVASAFSYAGRMGVDVVNASLAGTSPSAAVLDAVTRYPETLFIVAAGNAASNVDAAPTYPCAIPLPNVICVAATGQTNQLSSYSNYGAGAVDLAAPGDRILSTWPGATYLESTGTSMATPHVAGVAALLKARHPGATAATIRAALLGGTQPLPSLAGRTVTGGRLSAAGAFERMGDVVPVELRRDESREDRERRCDSKRRRRSGDRDERRGRARHRACGERWRR